MLVLLLMAVTGAMAEPITVTWTSSNGSFDNRVQYSGDGPRYEEDDWVLIEGGTFTTNLGNFTQIQISGGYFENYGADGWNDRTWTGNASSVYMNAFVASDHGNNHFTITFTIEPPTVNVTGITLDKTEASMIVGGETLTLTPTVLPAEATDKTVTWTTSDASVATVADGVVTAVGAGTATITATANDGSGVTGTCTVTVSPAGYSVALKEGTDDAANWQGKAGEGEYQALPLTGLKAGTAVSVKYSGTKKVKSVKAVKKATAAAKTLAEATSEDIGKIAGKDGKIYATKAAAEAVATGNAVAMIAYVGSETGDDTYKNGFAIALADEEPSNWSTAKSTCEGKSAVTNAAWLFPSQNQWKAMFKAFGDNEASYSGLNAALAAAGGDSSKLQENGNYWSSSHNGASAYIVGLKEGVTHWISGIIYVTGHVRACLAF